jgi:hypothetical protein
MKYFSLLAARLAVSIRVRDSETLVGEILILKKLAH